MCTPSNTWSSSLFLKWHVNRFSRFCRTHWCAKHTQTYTQTTLRHDICSNSPHTMATQPKTRKKLPSIEVGVRPTALTWPMTLTLTMTLTFNTLRAMVMTYSPAKVQGQRSIGSEDRVERNGRVDRRTGGRTDGGDRITSLTNAVGKNSNTLAFLR